MGAYVKTGKAASSVQKALFFGGLRPKMQDFSEIHARICEKTEKKRKKLLKMKVLCANVAVQ